MLRVMAPLAKRHEVRWVVASTINASHDVIHGHGWADPAGPAPWLRREHSIPQALPGPMRASRPQDGAAV